MIRVAETLRGEQFDDTRARLLNELRVVKALNNRALQKDKFVDLLKTQHFLFSDLSSNQIDELEECSQKASVEAEERQRQKKHEQNKKIAQKWVAGLITEIEKNMSINLANTRKISAEMQQDDVVEDSGTIEEEDMHQTDEVT